MVASNRVISWKRGEEQVNYRSVYFWRCVNQRKFHLHKVLRGIKKKEVITDLIYGHLGMVPSEQRASEVSMTWLLQPVSAHDWILSKAKQLRLLALGLLIFNVHFCNTFFDSKIFLTRVKRSKSRTAWHQHRTTACAAFLRALIP